MSERSSMLQRLSVTLLVAHLTMASAAAADGPRAGVQVADPHYGEVLFHFYQQDYFTALNKLQVSQSFGRLSSHADDAALLEGGLLLSWGQHEQAAGIFDQVLADASDPAVRDRARFYLGKARYQRGYLAAAEAAFLSVEGELPVSQAAERQNLLARIYLEQERYPEAVAVLSEWQGPQTWTAYARYNLGVALLRQGEFDSGAAVLEELGRMFVDGDEELALRDRANLALGFAYLQQQQPVEAKAVLRRVSINGPYSNKALLGAGWAASANQDYMRALAPWQELNRRDLLDSAVQESLLAVPYAYAQLDAEPQAAEAYAAALGIFDAEIARLDQAIAEADDGRLMNALLTDEQQTAGGWNWELQSLPEDDRSRYLYFSIADHRFHEALRSYRGLTALDNYLQQWELKLVAWQDMLAERQRRYTQRWPDLQARIAAFDAVAMQDSYSVLADQSATVSAGRDITAVSPAEQQAAQSRLTELQDHSAWDAPEAAELREQHRILEGLLFWELEKEFRVRDWRQQTAVSKLGRELEAVLARRSQLEQQAEAIPVQVDTFTARLAELRVELELGRGQLSAALQEHADYLNGAATAELRIHRERLVGYRAQARFALAAIYDRMSASNR